MTAEWLRDIGAVSDDRLLDRHHFDAAISAAKETVMEVTAGRACALTPSSRETNERALAIGAALEAL